ncbi:hypothetical protein, partial [Burkholderia ubonensis]|uniref:hypothetical protein n=2 Tax=Burkholderia ubonensis TaxID=101571 RepID=UPI001E3A7DA7
RLDGNRRFHPSESGSAMQSYFWDGTLGSVYIRNAHANARNRPQGKEEGAPFGRAKQATRDAAMRAISGIPLE